MKSYKNIYGNQWPTHLIRSCSTVKKTSLRGRVLPAGATQHDDLVAAFNSLFARAFICINSLFSTTISLIVCPAATTMMSGARALSSAAGEAVDHPGGGTRVQQEMTA
jgi:hypothetical protein